jgi:nicotinamide riboside transporter PnuC
MIIWFADFLPGYALLLFFWKKKAEHHVKKKTQRRVHLPRKIGSRFFVLFRIVVMFAYFEGFSS